MVLRFARVMIGISSFLLNATIDHMERLMSPSWSNFRFVYEDDLATGSHAPVEGLQKFEKNSPEL